MKNYEVVYTVEKLQIVKADSEEEAETKFTDKHSFRDGYEVVHVTEIEE